MVLHFVGETRTTNPNSSRVLKEEEAQSDNLASTHCLLGLPRCRDVLVKASFVTEVVSFAAN